MATIPASYDVNIIPGVINAGGAALSMDGLMLTQTLRIPQNTVQSFSGPAAVGALFGMTSNEYNKAVAYFPGFNNATAQPAAMLIASYPQTAVAAWLRSAPINTYSIPSLDTINNTLTIVMDGQIKTGTVNLSGAGSYSAAAGIIQTALNSAEPTEGTATAFTLAPGTSFIFTGSIADDVLTITAVTSGAAINGGVITGSNVTAGTQIVSQLTSTAPLGALGGVGTYAVSISQTVTSTTITETFGVLTTTTVGSGTFNVGATLSGTGVTAGTQLTQYGTGTGSNNGGTYYVNYSQTASTGTITAKETDCTVTYDSITGSLIVTSGITGTPSTVAYATGAAAAQLFMTQATGAVISQGAAAATPAAFMSTVTAVNQNWATMFTAFDPDSGAGNAQKYAFAVWANSTTNRYAYICWDSDVTPTLSNSATTCLGYLIGTNGSNLSGTCLINSSTDLNHQAMISGWAASINFQTVNGRISFKFKTQSGITASVTNQQIAANLTANGYNYVGAFATASQNFVYFSEGVVSGPFQWLDSYVNQIWMNAALQQAILNFLTQINSVPYNQNGYSLIEAACLTPINAALYFGSIQPGVPLTSSQIAQINNQAGVTANSSFSVSNVLAQTGWYLLIQPASGQVRQARTSPPIIFWYMDGESIHKINIASLDVQ